MHHDPNIRRFHPRTLLICLVLALVAVPVGAADPQGEPSIHDFTLSADLTGRVDAAGSLVFLPENSRPALLRGELISRSDARRRRGGDTFFTVVAEGVTGGRRGFSAQADDDGDGRVDEDPLDGIDNDGDGRIDEDFAAIGDAMATVQLNDPGQDDRGARLEFYHWDNSRLSSAVFLKAGGNTPPGRAVYRIRTAGEGWQEIGLRSLRHTLAGKTEQERLSAFVCRVARDRKFGEDDPCDPAAGRWLGVMILGDDAPARFILEEGRLDLPLGEEAVPLVICAADSWLQLNRMLGEARAVHRGLTDPVDNRRTPWIVPPTCGTCRSAPAPDFHLETGADDQWVLIADVDQGRCGLLDPDLFRVGSRALGSPRSIHWQGETGRPLEIAWTCRSVDNLKDGDPAGDAYVDLLADLSNHRLTGRLTFVFAPVATDPAAGTGSTPVAEVLGQFLDGRAFCSFFPEPTTPTADPAAPSDQNLSRSHDPDPEVVEETARGYAAERARLLKAGRHPPSLSPDLLVGWPNPFNDLINLRFTVPQTMREAFVWKNLADQPAEIELEGDVPWSGGRPSVSVKIYSMNGQELVTLHSAVEGAGEYTAQWNGTDAFGRKVASGTYFCKLQLDDWSVTRRLVFLR